jgi:hypothetical protein
MHQAAHGANIYDIFQTWWGEPLSADLVRRIVRAPAEHLHDFSLALHEPNLGPPELPSGFLRSEIHDRRLEISPEPQFALAAKLLLYVHEVVLDVPPIGPAILSGDRRLGRLPLDRERNRLVDQQVRPHRPPLPHHPDPSRRPHRHGRRPTARRPPRRARSDPAPITCALN